MAGSKKETIKNMDIDQDEESAKPPLSDEEEAQLNL